MSYEKFVTAGYKPGPSWWKVNVKDIIASAEGARRGKLRKLAVTPLGFPMYALCYGFENDETVPSQTNWSSATASKKLESFYTRGGKKQTFVYLAGVHATETEGICVSQHLISLLESGHDLRGREFPRLLELIQQYRFVIIPSGNMDGRSVSQDNVRNAVRADASKAGLGAWLDGTVNYWPECKQFFPMPMDKLSFPGGYTNSNGINIMHDATPGHIRSDEARAIIRLCEKEQADFMLNVHSGGSDPCLLPLTLLNYPSNYERGNELTQVVHYGLHAAGLRKNANSPTASKSCGLNLDQMCTFAAGTLAMTYESPYDEPTSYDDCCDMLLKTVELLLEDGLRKPFCDRIKMME